MPEHKPLWQRLEWMAGDSMVWTAHAGSTLDIIDNGGRYWIYVDAGLRHNFAGTLDEAKARAVELAQAEVRKLAEEWEI